ncbi:RNA polymerase I-specific transcription initiation factor-domain-containing protein [Hypoxylon sp. NC0597]|nr:RNA polymerase I-specific transcription initiation factor-domain-containing protein [Hypoxylon sp. NC0597]
MASTADESYEDVSGDDSDDSFEEDERPNRWRGAKSTWQHLNSEEIATLTALKEIRDRDLSVHLYNAFALKQRHKKAKDGVTPDSPVAGKDINAETGQLIQSDNWLPQRSWTAWPMRADKVPPPQDIPKSLVNDPDERYTFRKPVREMPSTVLEEIISGEILKAAKEKFNARPWVKSTESDEEADLDDGGAENEETDDETVASASASSRSRSRSRSRSKSVKPEYVSGDEKMDVDERLPEEIPPDEPLKIRRLRPEISTDDDLSYSLLRPSARHILAKLDATLTILHNAQESTINYQSDSGDSEASDASHPGSRRTPSRQRQRSQTSTVGGRRRGRPPGPSSRTVSRAQSRAKEATVPPEEDPTTKGEGSSTKKRRGRPKKVYPRLDGETDREFAIRIARLRKEAVPVFLDDLGPEPEPQSDQSDADDTGSESGNSGDGEETTGPSRGRPKRRKRTVSKANRSPSQASSISAGSRRHRQGPGPSRARVGLRDWRDVLGAAALAGFPPAALDRAARRCADLFGQSMTLQTLVEGPATSGRKVPLSKTMTYVPGMPQPPLLEEDEDKDEQQNQVSIHATSMAPGATSDDEAGSSQRQARSRSVSRPRARSRSRSVSAVPGSYLCSFRDCPRAANGEGFARRANLLRHLKLVHGWSASESGGDDAATPTTAAMFLMDEVDSEDEMYGAVHVDGFLKTIKMRRGWRAGDSGDEPRKRRSGYGRGRARSRGRTGGEAAWTDTDGDGDTRMDGANVSDE